MFFQAGIDREDHADRRSEEIEVAGGRPQAGGDVRLIDAKRSVIPRTKLFLPRTAGIGQRIWHVLQRRMRFSRVSTHERITELPFAAATQHVNMPRLSVGVAWGGTGDIENVDDVFFSDRVWTKSANGFPRPDNRVDDIGIRMHVRTGLHGVKNICVHGMPMMAQEKRGP